MVIYVVRQGDTVYSIAKEYGVSVQAIAKDNGMKNPDQLVVGQALVIMPSDVRHTVMYGQTLYAIARSYGTTIAAILAANPEITDSAKLSTGQVIVIPASGPKLGTMEVNGYGFANMDQDTLTQTLPYLTYISMFSYQVKPDGSLISIPAGPVIETARQAGVAPLMVITNIKEGGSFDSNIVHTVLTNEQVQNTLLENVIKTLKDNNYHGLDIDFEYIYPQDKENYNKFIKRAVAKLHPLGYTVSTALAPKASANQPGMLYQAHDYPVHGAVVDHVILMTYEWGYLYGPARAVAPVNLVEKVLQYAVSVMPSTKILMGIPNYGYDWTLPFVKGTAARSISNLEAVDIAAKMGAQIRYDTVAQSPFFNYYDKGRTHEVWFEDARSIQAKLKLVKKYNLAGVSYWNLNGFFPQNWLVQDSMYDVKKVL
ncbi:MAG TPA: glycosyl hydrolase family 18 protein [Oscillospiraceae bacterium]|nr:glycosyl hydrolase family 18 protein [Oscillospiraceae bacterium]